MSQAQNNSNLGASRFTIGLFGISALGAVFAAGFGFRLLQAPVTQGTAPLWATVIIYGLPLIGLSTAAALALVQSPNLRAPFFLIAMVFALAFSGPISEAFADLMVGPHLTSCRVLAIYDCSSKGRALSCVELEWRTPREQWLRSRFVVDASAIDSSFQRGDCVQAEIWPTNEILSGLTHDPQAQCRHFY